MIRHILGYFLISLMISFFLYIPIAMGISTLVALRCKKNRLLKTVIAVVILILIPTWDSLLGEMVYLYSCHFLARERIYTTVQTDGIYYEGKYNWVSEHSEESARKISGRDIPLAERTHVGGISSVFRKNYSYAESKVTRRLMLSDRIPPVYYRCTPLPEDPKQPSDIRTRCILVDQPVSRYMVKTKDTWIGTALIKRKMIYDRSTNQLMAEYCQVCKDKRPAYFSWIVTGIFGDDKIGDCRPTGGYDFDEFEYQVLTPKTMNSKKVRQR